MRMRRFLRTVILMLCMAAALAFTAGAAEKKDSQSAVTAKKVSGKTYLYYKDTGKKVKGLTGLQELPHSLIRGKITTTLPKTAS